MSAITVDSLDLDTLQMGEAIWNASRTSMFAPIWQMRQQGLVRRPVVLEIITDRSSMSLPHLLPEAPRGARYFPGDGTPTAPTVGPGVRPSAPVTVDLIINDAECQAALHRLDMWVWGQVMQTLSTPPPDPNDAGFALGGGGGFYTETLQHRSYEGESRAVMHLTSNARDEVALQKTAQYPQHSENCVVSDIASGSAVIPTVHLTGVSLQSHSCRAAWRLKKLVMVA